MYLHRKFLFCLAFGILAAGCAAGISDENGTNEIPVEPPNPPKKEICNNGIDDDGNGLIDCLDPACALESHCIVIIVPPEPCSVNGPVDCEDAACADDPACQLPPEKQCDKSAEIDCEDPLCVNEPACKEVIVIPADDDPIERYVDGIWVLPLTHAPYTTLQRAQRPTIGTERNPAEEVKSRIANRDLWVNQLDQYTRFGLGMEYVEGEPWIIREGLLSGQVPMISHRGQSLAYFWQVADPQLIDKESPCRLEGVYITPYVEASAYRPQSHLSTQMFDVHVQTARRLSDLSSRSFDFALVSGDMVDNAQENEMAWFVRIMSGGMLDPDSGIKNDPVPGPNNDFSDPFYAQGIGNIPWYPVIGNHDYLYMGFTPHDEKIQNACTGNEVIDLFDYIPVFANHEYRKGYRNGFRDASHPDAPIVDVGYTPADPARRLLTKNEALQALYDAPGLPAGHGFDPDRIAQGLGYYSTYPIPNRPIRLITLDTNHEEFSETHMTPLQFSWLKAEIADAASKNELVIVHSHHESKFSGQVTQYAFQEALASYSGVILHITGHGHKNGSNVYRRVNGQGYWEVMLASIISFPSQTRIFEIVHEGEGYISIYITNVDANVPQGSLAEWAMHLTAARDFFSFDKDPIATWEADKAHRNLILRTRVPKAIYENIDRYEWSTRIESIETLKALSFNPSR